MVTVEKLYPVLDRKKVIQNSEFIEKSWFLQDDSTFTKDMKEFYSPDIWFVGPKGELEKQLSQSILEAKDLVCICSFLLQESKITQAIQTVVEKNVRVYILTASENQLERDTTSEGENEDKTVVDHKKLLQILKKKCLIRTAPNFHAKFILIDPKSPKPRGFFCSANLNQNGLRKNVECGVLLNKTQVTELFTLFCQAFWDHSEHEYLLKSSLQGVKKRKNYSIEVAAFSQIISPFAANKIEATFQNLVEKSRGDIYLSTFSIEKDTAFFETLKDQCRKKRNVNLFTWIRAKNSEALFELKENGASIKGHPFLHFKCLVIDDPKAPQGILYTGNFTQESFDTSFDFGLYLNLIQVTTLLNILKQWKKNFPGRFISNEKVIDAECGKYLCWNPKREDFELLPETQIDLGVYEGNDLFSYPELEPPLKTSLDSSKRFKSIQYTWRVSPPKLPAKAKPFLLESKEEDLKDLEIYELKKQRYLVLDPGKDIKELQRISAKINAKLVIK